MKTLSFVVEGILAQQMEDMAPPESVQLHNSRIDRKGKNGSKFARWQPVLIENLTTGGRTIRHARGGKFRSGLTVNSIVLDYDGQVDLDIKKGAYNEVLVRKAKWSEVLRFYYNSKNSLTRVTTRMAVLSIVLGAVGLVIGVLGFVAAFF